MKVLFMKFVRDQKGYISFIYHQAEMNTIW